ncbi:TenA family protein [Ochrobactrum haematophilum]|uniref:TenA family protein n=1 Tax=Brucella haematophila TaxID=419474 RepID=A0ABX1DK78_9HYPH|nr:TenA family protein [Brucella haematophila]
MSQPQPHYSSELFTRLRAATPGDWKPYIEHEFVRGLGDGTLPKAAFLHYLRQDYVYLHHYARAFALGVVKANTLQETRLCADIMHGLAHMELPLHVSICAREGISEDELYATKEEPENLAYTRYVLDCGQAGDFLDLLTALVPCAHGYGEIGLNLAVTALPGTPYQEWIDTYAGPNIRTCATRSASCLIRLPKTASATTSRKARAGQDSARFLPPQAGSKPSSGRWG